MYFGTSYISTSSLEPPTIRSVSDLLILAQEILRYAYHADYVRNMLFLDIMCECVDFHNKKKKLN
jgi:hypothetical protein